MPGLVRFGAGKQIFIMGDDINNETALGITSEQSKKVQQFNAYALNCWTVIIARGKLMY